MRVARSPLARLRRRSTRRAARRPGARRATSGTAPPGAPAKSRPAVAAMRSQAGTLPRWWTCLHPLRPGPRPSRGRGRAHRIPARGCHPWCAAGPRRARTPQSSQQSARLQLSSAGTTGLIHRMQRAGRHARSPPARQAWGSAAPDLRDPDTGGRGVGLARGGRSTRSSTTIIDRGGGGSIVPGERRGRQRTSRDSRGGGR